MGASFGCSNCYVYSHVRAQGFSYPILTITKPARRHREKYVLFVSTRVARRLCRLSEAPTPLLLAVEAPPENTLFN